MKKIRPRVGAKFNTGTKRHGGRKRPPQELLFCENCGWDIPFGHGSDVFCSKECFEEAKSKGRKL